MVSRAPKEDGCEDREARILQEVGGCSFFGRPVSIAYLPGLTAWSGKLLTHDAAQRGTPVHAGSFLRERRIVLDAGLSAREHHRILLHELFHFAWIRLSNAHRKSYAALIARELAQGARGELGWSAEWRKADVPNRSPRFLREYLSESFCDTAAWRYGRLRVHDEFTLALRWRTARRAWLDDAFPNRLVKL